MPVDPPDGLPAEERTPDYATILERLRARFPGWAFLHDPGSGTWIALRGTAEHGVTIRHVDPLALRLAVEETMRGRR